MAKQSTQPTKATKKTTKRKSTPKSKAGKKPDGTCFILMPFREPFDTYCRTIFEPAVKASNLKPLRGDSLFTPTPIMSDIWQMIRNAKVLLAELTTKNANVFYELGLAHAIGKPVVLVTETMGDVPFDLQQYRVITYNKDDPAWGDKLQGEIQRSLAETLADPVEAVPSMYRKKVKSQAPEDTEVNIRLDHLERQVNSLSKSTGFGGRVVEELNTREKVRNMLYKLKTPEQLVSIIDAALESGVPKAEIDSILMSRASELEGIADEFMKASGSLPYDPSKGMATITSDNKKD